MSERIFLADYSSCAALENEIDSNNNIIDHITNYIKCADDSIASMTSGAWSSSSYESTSTSTKNLLTQESDRYINFNTTFLTFYEPLEAFDRSLGALYKSRLEILKDIKDYEIFSSVLNLSAEVQALEAFEELLIESGMSEEEAAVAVVLLSSETREEWSKIANMSEDEINEYMEALNVSDERSIAQEALLAFWNKVDPTDTMNAAGNMKDIAESLINVGLTDAIIAAICGTKNITKASTNLKYSQVMKGVNNAFRNADKGPWGGGGYMSAKSAANLTAQMDDAINLRNSNLAKLQQAAKLQNTTKTILNMVNIALIIVEVGISSYDNWKNYDDYGVELDDAFVSWSLDIGKIAATVGLSSKFGTVVGTALFPGLGSAAGAAGGFVVGVVVAVGWDLIVEPVVTTIYDEILEPIGSAISDWGNGVADWWDSLAW